MDIQITPIRYEQKSVLRQMTELYLYDFSEFSGEDLNPYGYFGYPRIDDYWNEEGRRPFFILADGKYAGFVLVRGACEFHDLPDPHSIAEFFVLKKYRRLGVGKRVALQIFSMFPGSWEVSYWTSNRPAQRFWEETVAEYTGGDYEAFTAPDRGEAGFTFISRT